MTLTDWKQLTKNYSLKLSDWNWLTDTNWLKLIDFEQRCRPLVITEWMTVADLTNLIEWNEWLKLSDWESSYKPLVLFLLIIGVYIWVTRLQAWIVKVTGFLWGRALYTTPVAVISRFRIKLRFSFMLMVKFKFRFMFRFWILLNGSSKPFLIFSQKHPPTPTHPPDS